MAGMANAFQTATPKQSAEKMRQLGRNCVLSTSVAQSLASVVPQKSSAWTHATVTPKHAKRSVPQGNSGSVLNRVIGYYESWSLTRPCSSWAPSQIPANGYTHLYFAFASIDPTSSQIVPASPGDVPLYRNFTALKTQNIGLKTYISIGGWAFNDPPTQRVFSEVAADAGKSQTFAKSVVNFMITYGFDGADIDWEYPVACERGGVPADQKNYVTLMKTLRKTFDSSGHSFGLTFTAPTSYWYLQHFDLPGLLESADWINLMTYDLHGVWDAESVFTGNVIGAHTNLTEIDNSLQLFIRVGVDLNKIVLGLGFYGRSFELQDKSCFDPTKGCHFSGPAAGGPCTQAGGILSYSEIQDVLTRTNATPVWDKTAAVKYFGFDDGVNLNQWVSFDDADTFKQKIDYANKANLAGVMIWAVDQDDFAGDALSGVLGKPITNIPKPTGIGSNDGQSCVTMDCGTSCPSGFVQLFSIDNSYHNLDDNTCPADTIVVGYSYDCGGFLGLACCPINEAQLCCKPPGGSIATAPFTLGEIFDDPPQDEDLTWDVQEENIDENDSQAGSGDENDIPFGLVAVDGPDGFVSDMSFKSNWVITGCNNTEDQQTATAFCSKGDADEAYACNLWPGPYARVVSLTPKAGKRMIRTKRGETATMYDFTFDYRFDLIKADDDTEVLMRIDVTNMPGYWDEVVTADVRRRDLLDDPELIKRGIEERWFGGFSDWLTKATSVAKDTSADLLIAKGFSANLFSFSQNCVSEDATTEFAASLDVTAHGSASVHIKYGFYVEAHILPTAKIDAAYLYIIGNAGAEIGIDITGKASVTYTGKRLQLIPEITWPGLSYPGLAKIGPALNIYGQITGGASLSGTFSLLASWDSGEIYYSLGTGDQHTDSGADSSWKNNGLGINIQPQADIEFSGVLAVHAIPEISIGVSVLRLPSSDHWAIEANAKLTMDGQLSATLSTSLSSGTIDVAVGYRVDLDGSVEGTGFNLGNIHFFDVHDTIYSHSISLTSSNDRRSLPASSIWPGNDTALSPREVHPRSLFPGDFTCPKSDNSSDVAGCFAEVEKDDDTDPDDQDDRQARRSIWDSYFGEHEPFQNALASRGALIQNSILRLTIPTKYYRASPQGNWIFFSNPTDAESTSINEYTQQQAGNYDREHVYEIGLLTKFISDILVNTPAILQGMNSCNWVKTYIYQKWPGRTTTMAQDLGNTLPGNADEFPMLSKLINQAKVGQLLTGRGRFRKPSTLAGYSNSKLVYSIRSAVAVIDYMNTNDARNLFVRNSNDVRDLWIDFFDRYETATGIHYDVASAYDDWIENTIVGGTQARVQAFVTAARAVLNGRFTAGSNTIQVKVPLDCSTVTDSLNFNQIQNAWDVDDIAWRP
ncbi:hypothetical protein BD779DRAFT_1680159 [Infundibulicybe gibba]|nr:hypothetical protein BD779DRAFT_1680159 [Infundibulicybe gibba]